jgi:hypothetical protein
MGPDAVGYGSSQPQTIMQAAPSRPAAAPIARRPVAPIEYFRGVSFVREVIPAPQQNAGSVCWRMVFPVAGPSFPDMNKARKWCRVNGIQSPVWYRGMSHNPAQW